VLNVSVSRLVVGRRYEVGVAAGDRAAA